MLIAKPSACAAADSVDWLENPDSKSWDSALAALGGHPLQSALWGDGRREVDGIRDYRLMALREGLPVWMIRVEERRIPLLGSIGWAPKGPSGDCNEFGEGLQSAAMERLKQRGMLAVITDRWLPVPPDQGQSDTKPVSPRTIWIDLSVGRESLWLKLDKQWRYGVGRAARLGVHVEAADSAEDVKGFFLLCEKISHEKEFDLPASLALMQRLLGSTNSTDVQARLFVARVNGHLGAGAFIIRCGHSIHYFWGATDRSYSKERVGEAVQWAVIEWALANNWRRYDLEGIDPTNNRGVYEFKKRMGGREVTLIGKRLHALTARGQALAWLRSKLY